MIDDDEWARSRAGFEQRWGPPDSGNQKWKIFLDQYNRERRGDNVDYKAAISVMKRLMEEWELEEQQASAIKRCEEYEEAMEAEALVAQLDRAADF